jgi:hypothetical protein
MGMLLIPHSLEDKVRADMGHLPFKTRATTTTWPNYFFPLVIFTGA